MATAAAAIAGRLCREVEEHFCERDAFSPDRAVEFEPRASIQQRYLEQLMAEGILHEARPGQYWFDLPAFQRMRRERMTWAMRILAMAAVVFLVVLLVDYFQKR